MNFTRTESLVLHSKPTTHEQREDTPTRCALSFYHTDQRERKPPPTTQEKPTNNRDKTIKASEATNTIQATERTKQSKKIGAKPTKLAAFRFLTFNRLTLHA